MSAKWVRSQAWDKAHLTGPITPVRWLLHAFSSITLSVVLLGGVAIYGVMASVPVGLLALIPTYLIYGLTLLLTFGLLGVLPAWGVWRATRRAGFGMRFTIVTLLLIGSAALSWWLWLNVAWPALAYSETTGQGFRLFPEFVKQYKAVTVRRTPWLEMSELEFYGWWPLKVLLLAFVVNMTTATLRRIEFNLPNLGVLTVHTGIVMLGLGSAIYAAAKVEGDVFLVAGPPGPPAAGKKSGEPTPGPMEVGFFDNTRVVLRLKQQRSVAELQAIGAPPDAEFEQRLIDGLPRYNDYNLGAVTTLDRKATGDDRGRRLSIPVPPPSDPRHALVDPDINFRVVGYAAATEVTNAWTELPVAAGSEPRPVRYVDMLTSLNPDGTPRRDGGFRLVQQMGFMPTVPSERVVQIRDALSIEYTRGMSEQRWAQLTAAIPMPSDPNKRPAGGVIIDIPAAGVSRMYPSEPGAVIQVEGYTVEFVSLSPKPPFPIITPGFEGASSSVAVFRITPPEGVNGGKAYERYVYSRFPEITQDLSLSERNTQGMPARSAPAKDITLTFVDATMVHVVMDERADGTVRAFIRGPLPNGVTPILTDTLRTGDALPVGPSLSLRLGKTLPNVERTSVPVALTGPAREKDLGTHKQAALALEVSVPASGNRPAWTRTMWLPFQLYTSERIGNTATRVALPDGRTVEVSFGRLWHRLPGMGLQLADFQMIPYPHSQQPQDFRSQLVVSKFDRDGTVAVDEVRYTSLNDPLLESPFFWSKERGWLPNALGWLGGSLSGTRFKFSQSGWDSGGWTETKALVDSGELSRPYGRFTILGVGNNPGIKIIAAGSVITCLGVPWAFYVKPWIMRRRKAAFAKAAAEGRMPARPHPTTQPLATEATR